MLDQKSLLARVEKLQLKVINFVNNKRMNRNIFMKHRFFEYIVEKES